MGMFTRVSAALILTLRLTCRIVAATAVVAIHVDFNPHIGGAAIVGVNLAASENCDQRFGGRADLILRIGRKREG
jgi:hypothetical protein